MISNYHTHTMYCDGKDTPQALVQEAIRLGCPEIGFSGHAFTEFDQSYCMSKEGTEVYKASVRTLQKQYAGRIRILLGIEQDYYAEEPTDGYDYVIGAVHYVLQDGVYLPVDLCRESQIELVRQYYGGDFYAFVEAYFATVGALYEKTRCDIVAHFDLITKFNEDGKLFDTSHPRYQAAVHAALDRLCDTPARFEINTGAMSRGYRTAPYPAADIIAEIQRKGQQFVFSSDCHARENLLFGWEQCSKLYGFLNDVRLKK